MTQEIERKFLVKNNDFKKESFKETRIIQGFLSTVPERTVRVRIKGIRGFLTIKGISNESGTTRYEWEKEIVTVLPMSLRQAGNLYEDNSDYFEEIAEKWGRREYQKLKNKI